MYEQTFPERAREHEANHVRLLEVQTLDALLRIEELLEKLVRDKAPYTGEDITDVLKVIEPTETPFMASLKTEKKPRAKLRS